MTTQTTTGAAQAGTERAIERMATAAEAFLASLQPAQRQKALYPFPEEEERRRWYYTPTERGGLTLGEMYPAQQRLAHRLVASGLSAGGYVTASTIMGLENTLDAREGFGEARPEFPTYPGRPNHPRGRDPLMYFLAVFGEPGARTWGWRFGGHHIALSYTIVDGRLVSPTPSFFGADPADAPQVGPAILRPLAGEEDLGRELLLALDDSQRAVAIISPVAPLDLVLRNRPRVEDGISPLDPWPIFSEAASTSMRTFFRDRDATRLARLGFTAEHAEAVRYTRTPKGLAAAAMSAKQREILTALIRQYINRMPDEIAEHELAKLGGNAFEAIHFAWAGSARRREPHYYRLQGPRFLVEYDNVQNDANHIHSVWRDPEGDFGTDLLAEHYRQAH